MSNNAIVSIDPLVLAEVTGGKSSGGNSGSSGSGSASFAGSSIDGLLNQLNSITGSIKDIKTKTSGLSQTEMLMLCVLAAQNRPSASVVYVGARRW